MSEVPRESQLSPLTPEIIHELTGFKLIIIFTDFERTRRISPDLHEERERLSSELGEDNVSPSFYTDKDGVIQLGLFVRDKEGDPRDHPSS